jgi:hypothetical protein
MSSQVAIPTGSKARRWNAMTVKSIAVILIGLVALSAKAQGGRDLATPRDSRSPDQRYEWVLDTSEVVSYKLLDRQRENAVIASVPDYFADADKDLAVSHGSKFRVFWNGRGDLVILDEFNYRRAGELYAFFVREGRADQLKLPLSELSIPEKANAKTDEVRLTAQSEPGATKPILLGWISDLVFQARLAIKLTDGSFESLPCKIDFENRERPRLEIQGG